jgi:hypothetical protein
MFNAYQQTQGRALENTIQSMVGSGFVAAFIGHAPATVCLKPPKLKSGLGDDYGEMGISNREIRKC